jgi:hypothetical protein
MNRTIIIVLVLLIIAIFGYIFFSGRNETRVPVTNETADQVDQTNTDQNDQEISGSVVSINVDQVPVDGPSLITIRTESGAQTVVAIPSMGINLCAAQANIMNIGELKVGDEVQARGQVGVNGTIIPCESSDHFLRVAN